MPKDYLIDYITMNMKIANGDFVVGDSTKQHQRSLLLAHKGAYKQHPLAGVGASDFIDDESPDALMRETRKQMVQDGMVVNNLGITAKGIALDAAYDY